MKLGAAVQAASLGIAMTLTAGWTTGYLARQSELAEARNIELTKIENHHSREVRSRLLADEEEYLRMERQKTEFPSMEEMEPIATRCFKSINCYKLAEAVYHEDRGGGMEGMKAVANVIMNRVNNNKFPSTIADVVNQRRKNSAGVMVCQFSYVCLKKSLRMENKEWKLKSGWIAMKAYRGNLRDRTNGADHYYNPDRVKATPKFAKVYPLVASISDHLFYRSVLTYD